MFRLTKLIKSFKNRIHDARDNMPDEAIILISRCEATLILIVLKQYLEDHGEFTMITQEKYKEEMRKQIDKMSKK
jgi:hypothetical protein